VKNIQHLDKGDKNLFSTERVKPTVHRLFMPLDLVFKGHLSSSTVVVKKLLKSAFNN